MLKYLPLSNFPAFFFRIGVLCATLAVLAAGFTGAAGAQEERPETAAIRSALAEAAATLRTDNLDEDALIDLREEIAPYLPVLQTRISARSPALAQVEARLAELEPAEGEEVPPALKDEYENLQESADNLRAEINLSRSLIVEASQLLEAIAAERQQLFQNRLLAYTPSLFSPEFYAALETELPAAATRLREGVKDWAEVMEDISPLAHAGTLIILAGTAIAAYALWNRLLMSRFLRYNARARPSTAVLVRFLVMSIALFLAIALGNHVLRVSGYVPDSYDGLLTTLSVALGLTVAFLSLSKAVLDPYNEESYLTALTRAQRHHVHRMITLVLSLVLYHAVVLAIFRLAEVPVSTVTLHSLVLSGLLGIAFGRLGGAIRAGGGEKRRLPRLLAIFFMVAAVAAPAATAFGYVALGNFIITQGIWISFILALAWLVMQWLTEQLAARPEEEKESVVLHFLTRRTGMGQQGAQLFSVFLLGLGRLAVVFAALAAMALPWGGAGETVFARIAGNFNGFDLGGLRISPLDVLVAIALFLTGLGIVRLVKQWFSHSFLPLTRFDEGIQNSLSTFAGYVGFILVVVITLAYLGVALQNLAIIAGALSVGIGFGLQSIVNNFVSGLILLAERPFKVGDWIVVGAEQGNVRRINVRATEIETFDRASIIVPNADLITGVVKNWTHSNRTGRIIVTVGVSYDADPEQVRDILLKCASEHPDILTYPEPAVFFQDFGDNALIFEIFAFLGAVDKGLGTKSDLRYAIYRELKAAGIAIPYPQRDVNLKGEVRLDARGAPVAFTADASAASRASLPPEAPSGEGEAGPDAKG